jgi:hypothetical protein
MASATSPWSIASETYERRNERRAGKGREEERRDTGRRELSPMEMGMTG